MDKANHDIHIYRGDTPSFYYQLLDVNDETGEETPIDITRHTFKAQVRYNVEDPDIWFELPIVKHNPKQGQFKWSVTKEVSEQLLPFGSGLPNTAVYDIQAELEGAVFTFAYGKFNVSRDITQG
ncbi:TPA: hypothetical protein PMC50_002509 [Vibrio cholerae]|nr:hypothetical protein [Vibrio cholerae]